MNKGNLSNLMKEAQKMQEKMEQAQKELEQMVVVGSAGAGLVKVEMTGRHYVKRVILHDHMMDEDKTMMEDLIAAAVNDAVAKVEKETRGKMSSLTAGLNLPGGMGGSGSPFGGA